MQTQRETAERIRLLVASKITHDYQSQSEKFTPESVLSQGSGRCGHRACLFQKLALEAGLTSRIFMYRGHVTNKVLIDGEWLPFDATTPINRFQSELIDIITRGPLYGWSDDPYYSKTKNWTPCSYEYGQYSSWLLLLKKHANIVTPAALLNKKVKLSWLKPNVIIRHDVDFQPLKLLPMLNEENALDIRSVTYLRADNEEYSIDEYGPLAWQFEVGGFEFGLHLTAVNRRDMTKDEAMKRLNQQLEAAKRHFKVESIQAHGYDGLEGCLDNYVVESWLPNGFTNIIEGTRRFKWRIADSCGVMFPGDPAEWIPKMRRGGLYYCLWHPEYYSFNSQWVEYSGRFNEENGRGI
jgi:hypothetical protein